MRGLRARSLILIVVDRLRFFGLLAKPEITLVDLDLTDLTLFETSGIFTVRLANENPEPLAVSGGVYNLYLGGWKIGKGLSNHAIEIPALGTATDEVELHLSNLAIATQIRSLYESGIVDYRIKAKIYIERSYGRRSMTINNEGRFDFNSNGGKSSGGNSTGTSAGGNSASGNSVAQPATSSSDL